MSWFSKMPATLPFALVLAACWAILIWSSGKGFGFIDEGYYVIAIDNPAQMSASVTQFAYLWHPLYRLAGGDVAVFRLLGACVLEIGAFIFAIAFARFLRPSLPTPPAILVLALCTVVWWQLGWWRQSTPNYNQLNLIGTMLFLAGLFEAVTRSRAGGRGTYHILPAAMLAGGGFAVMALVKASSAIACVVLGLAWLCTMPVRSRLAHLGATSLMSVTIFGLAILLIFGSFTAYFRAIADGLTLMFLLGPTAPLHTLAAIFSFPLDGNRPWQMVTVIALGAIGIWAIQKWLDAIRRNASSADTTPRIMIAAGALAIFLLMAWARGSTEPLNRTVLHALSFIFPGACVAIAIYSWNQHNRGTAWNEAARATPFLLLAPFCYSFGTTTWIYQSLPGGALFWCAAALSITCSTPRPMRALAMTWAAAFSVAVTLGFLVGFATKPTVQAPALWRHDRPIAIGPEDAVLSVDEATHRYLRALLVAREQGFRPGMTLYDFSRTGPGAGFLLKASAPVTPMIGYGDARFWQWVLDRSPDAARDTAWILVDQRDIKRISRLKWTANGRRFPDNYQQVMSVNADAFGLVNTMWKPRIGAH